MPVCIHASLFKHEVKKKKIKKKSVLLTGSLPKMVTENAYYPEAP